MSKRSAQYDINVNSDNEQDAHQVAERVNTQDEIAQRKIIRIKGPKQFNDKAIKLIINAPLPNFSQLVDPPKKNDESPKKNEEPPKKNEEFIHINQQSLPDQVISRQKTDNEQKRLDSLTSGTKNEEIIYQLFPSVHDSGLKIFEPGAKLPSQIQVSENTSITALLSPIIFRKTSQEGQLKKLNLDEVEKTLIKSFCITSAKVNNQITFSVGIMKLYQSSKFYLAFIHIADQVQNYSCSLQLEQATQMNQLENKVKIQARIGEQHELDTIQLKFQNIEETQLFVTEINNLFNAVVNK